MADLIASWWVPWEVEVLPGEFSMEPAVASWAPGRLDVFVNRSSNLLHKPSNNWSAWEDMGVFITLSPAAVSGEPNRIDLIARGTAGLLANLVHAYWTGTTWSGWENLGGHTPDSPAVTSWGPDRLDVFVKGTDNGLWHRAFYNGKWHAWEDLKGTLRGPPGAVSWGPGRIDVFARGDDDNIWQKTWDNAWKPWEPTQYAMFAPTKPAVASARPGQFSLFWKLTDKPAGDSYEVAGYTKEKGWYRVGDTMEWTVRVEPMPGAWSEPQRKFASAPAAVGNRKDGSIHLFGALSDGGLWHGRFESERQIFDTPSPPKPPPPAPPAVKPELTVRLSTSAIGGQVVYPAKPLPGGDASSVEVRSSGATVPTPTVFDGTSWRLEGPGGGTWEIHARIVVAFEPTELGGLARAVEGQRTITTNWGAGKRHFTTFALDYQPATAGESEKITVTAANVES